MPAFSEDSPTAIRSTHTMPYLQPVKTLKYHTTPGGPCENVNNDDLLGLCRRQIGKGAFLLDEWPRRASDRKVVRKGRPTFDPFNVRGRTVYGTFEDCHRRQRILEIKYKAQHSDKALFESRRKRVRFTTPPNSSNESTPLSTPMLSQSGSTDNSSDEECSANCTASGRCHSCRIDELFDMYINTNTCT